MKDKETDQHAKRSGEAKVLSALFVLMLAAALGFIAFAIFLGTGTKP